MKLADLYRLYIQRLVLTLLVVASLVSPAVAEIRTDGTPGAGDNAVYGDVERAAGDHFAVQLKEATGFSTGNGIFVATDSEILAAAGGTLPAGDYIVTRRPGNYASPSDSDAPGPPSVLHWNGTRELSEAEALAAAASIVDTPAQVHNDEPDPSFTAKLGTRADGVTTAFPTLTIRPGEKTHVWVDMTKVVSINLATAANGTSTSGHVAVDAVGVYGKFVSIVLDGTSAVDGDTATIKCDVTPRGSQVRKVSLSITVSAD